MSRSGLSEDCDEQWMEALYRGRVANATRSRRGQKFFREMLAALDTMPVKELHAHVFDKGAVLADDHLLDGGCCALGALARSKGIDITKADPEDDQVAWELAQDFDIAECLAREVIWANDEWSRSTPVRDEHQRIVRWVPETPDERWKRMRHWVESQIRQDAEAAP